MLYNTASLFFSAALPLALLLHRRLGVLGIVVALAALTYLRRPHWFIHLTIIAAFITVPAQVPTAYHPGPYTVPYYLLAAVPAVLYCAKRLRPPRTLKTLMLCLSGVLLVGMTVGFAENEGFWVISEALNLVAVPAAVFLAACATGTQHQAPCLKVVRVVLWISAAQVLAASAGVLHIAGRTEVAHVGNEVSSATRLLTPTQFLALVVALGSALMVTFGHVSLRRVAGWLAPALVVLLLAFSRNTVLAVGVVAVYVLAALRERAARVVLRASVAVVLMTPIVLVSLALGTQTSAGPYLRAQVAAFDTRVLGGLVTSVRADDPSLIARRRENAALRSAITPALFGHGFGYPYQNASGTDFSANQGRYYAHEFYLWLLIKTGVVGLVLWCCALAAPVLRALRGRTTLEVVMGAISAALLIVCTVAPLPEDSNNAPLFGATFGVLVALLGGSTRNQVQVARAHAARTGVDGDPATTPLAPQQVLLATERTISRR